jgi:hypothetical protein
MDTNGRSLPVELKCPMLSNKNLNAALRLAGCGTRIFPAKPVLKDSGDWNKPPYITGWQSNSTTDPQQIREWWRQWPNAIPALPCDSFFVLDVDRHVGGNDGVAALHDLINANGGLPDHPIVGTPSRGEHHYFRQPDSPLGNGAASLPPGIDVRGIGGYVIGPGATLPNGKSWRPIRAGSGTPEWPLPPEWLLRLIRDESQRPTVSRSHSSIIREPSSREERYAITALAGVAEEIRTAPVGRRNTVLNATAYRLGRMVSAGWIDRLTVENELRLAAFALANDDGAASVLKTIASGLNDGCCNPHPPLANRKRGWK